MSNQDGTHYRKVFDSPYLGAADVVDPITLTIDRVTQEPDKTKKTKDVFNTAYFKEREIRPGEKLKPMILNATNSKTMDKLSGSPFIEDWAGTKLVVYVDNNIRFGKDLVEGLRIRAALARKTLTPDQAKGWENAKAAYLRDGNLDKVLAMVDMSEDDIARLIEECAPVTE